MRLKCNPVCCAFAWSPSCFGTPAMVAAASFDGAMTDDFGSDATLSIFLADTTQTDEEAMRVVGHITIPDRACRVDWSTHTGAQGIIAVACANGHVYIYSVATILQSAPPNAPGDGAHALLWTITEHAGGAVRGCHANSAQPSCLATGGDDGRWFVWNLPASASDKSAPQKIAVIPNSGHNAPIVDVRWHAKNTFILASASADGVIKVWNMSSEKMASSLSTQRASHGAALTRIAWHPTAATLAVALDDPYPVVQIWDLRKSMAPAMELKGHERGVTALSWSTQDGELLASCDAGGQTYWWNTQTGEKSGALAPETSYVLDVQWSPVMPAVLATSSFEPSLCVSTADSTSSASGTAPEWMKRPCGASINVVNVVASLVPGTDMSLQLTRLPDEPLSPTLSSDELVQRELAQLPAGSPELQHWLHRHGYELLSAMTASRADRQPILQYLSAAEQATENAQGGADSDDPFAELAQEQAKTFEERAAELVAKGQIEEAVDLCLNECRFDDAFTLAVLRGVDLVNHTRDAYVQYTTQRHPERRHVLYAGAIATGNYGALIGGDMPWREALSAIVSFAGDDFAEACTQLGDVLKDKGEAEGAYTCYVCSRNVDAVVELWRVQDRPHREIVRDARILEETAERRCTHPFLADCFCEIGTHLLYGGHAAEALPYLQRAAEMGAATAQELVDRMKYCVPGAATRAGQPFSVEAVADQPSQHALAWMAQRQAQAQAQAQQQQQQHQQQQQQHQQHQQQQRQQAPPMPPHATAPAPGSFPPHAPAQPAQPWTAQHQGGPASSAAPSPGYNNAQPSPMARQPPAGTNPPQSSAPFHPTLMPGQAPPQSYNPAVATRPPLMPGAVPSALSGASTPSFPGAAPQPPARANVMPPPPPSGVSAVPQGRPPSASAGSGLMGHIPAPVGPPQPRLMPHPVSSFSSMRAGSTPNSTALAPSPGGLLPSSGSRAASQPHMTGALPPQSRGGYPQSAMMSTAGGSLSGSMAAAPPGSAPAPVAPPPPAQAPPTIPAPQQQQQVSLASMNPNEIQHPAGNQMIQRLQQILPQIADARRRGAIEQAAVQLFYALCAQQLPDDLIQMLYQLVCNAGSPTVRTMWSQISARHAQAVQPFANLRFL